MERSIAQYADIEYVEMKETMEMVNITRAEEEDRKLRSKVNSLLLAKPTII